MAPVQSLMQGQYLLGSGLVVVAVTVSGSTGGMGVQRGKVPRWHQTYFSIHLHKVKAQ